jgi:hypothetical protein
MSSASTADPTTEQEAASAAADPALTPSEWVSEFARGWEAPADADAFSDHFEGLLHPEIRLVQPQLPTVVGRRAFRERFARPLFAMVDDLHASVETWAARGDTLFIELTFEGSLGGRPLRWAGIDRITLKDGLATERVARFDPLPILAAVATRPRAWPRFARMRAGAVVAAVRGGGS